MSWRKNNKIYHNNYKDFDVLYVKFTHNDIKKLRARNWLKANRIRGTKK